MFTLEGQHGQVLIDWQAVAEERYRLRRNWLRGRYTVRTFLGHGQGICVRASVFMCW